ncbi:sirohydrochlorin chelatase [Tepidimonas alkaliphilus]|nr:CbiX/SirB N-terminal domain-containing protein [Tepidimonas alkaliphilus]
MEPSARMQTAPPAADGLLLLAHGARDPAWAAPFERVVAHVRAAQPALAVQLAFLERLTPNPAQAGATLAAAGCRHVVVLPLFLGSGGHVQRDVPQRVAALVSAHPGVRWTLAPTVGNDELLVQALASIALRHLNAPPRLDPGS